MGDHTHAEAQGEAPSFVTPGLTGVTAYYLKLPGSDNFPIFRYMLIGIAAGPPGGELLKVPGVTTHTYFKGEPPAPLIPPPPPNIDRALERINKGFLQWERDYDSLDIGSWLGFP